MNLQNELIKLTTNDFGEISQIFFGDQALLHDGKTAWAKVYPMIWPNLSFSRGFEVENINYELPKHGFWKELLWEQIYEQDSLVLLSTHLATSRYPFNIDIEHRIVIEDNTIKLSTKFSNLDHDKSAYFHFGHHPAFKIDENSELSVDPQVLPWKIDFQGALVRENVKLTTFQKMGFGVEYDTLVFKSIPFAKFSFVSHGVKITLENENFSSVQIWKPKIAPFICVEPWEGWNDDEYRAPHIAKNKTNIIDLAPGKSITKTIKLTFERC